VSLLSHIKNRTAACCHTQSIRKGKQRIDVRCEPQPWLAVDFDSLCSPLGPNDTRPDFLFVSNDGGGRLAPVEMSDGQGKKADKIRSQLQSGADWAHGILPDEYKPLLLPLYVGKTRRSVRGELRKPHTKVTFRGQAELVRLLVSPGKIPSR